MLPRWMKWLFIAFLAYLLVLGHRAGREAAPVHPVGVTAITAAQYPALATALDLDHWKRGIDPDYAAKDPCAVAHPGTGLGLKMIEDAPGAGVGAACGDTIAARVTVWNSSGGKSYEGVVPLTLGDRTVAAGLDQGLVDLREGGVRTLILPPEAMTHRKGSTAPAALLAALPANKMAVVTVARVADAPSPAAPAKLQPTTQAPPR
jgi:hypothetical protein